MRILTLIFMIKYIVFNAPDWHKFSPIQDAFFWITPTIQGIVENDPADTPWLFFESQMESLTTEQHSPNRGDQCISIHQLY